MNEQPYKNSPEIIPDDGFAAGEDAALFQDTAPAEGVPGVAMEADTAFDEYPDSLEGLEVTELDPEDKEVIEAFGRLSPEEQNMIAEIAETSEATLHDALTLSGESGHNRRIAALGDAFSATESEGDNPSKASFLKKFLDGSLRVVRHAGTAGLVAVAALSHTDDAKAQGFIDFLPAVAGIAAAQNPRLSRQIEGGVIRPIERQMQGKQGIERIMQQQQILQMKYAKLDREKEELLLRAAGNSQIARVENRIEDRIRPVEIGAKYQADKAQLKADRAQLRAAYLSRPAQTEAEQAKYEAQIEQLNAREARLDAQYEMSTVKDEFGRDTKYMKAEHRSSDVYDQIARKSMEQERIMAQIQKLNIDMEKIRYSTSRDATRAILRSF